MGDEADSANIQTFADHVLRKESRLTSRFASFTTETKIARNFTSALDNRFVVKIEVTKLRQLEVQSTIRVFDPDQVHEVLRSGPKSLAKQAGAVRAAMRRNNEVLIEGQIPAALLLPVS